MARDDERLRRSQQEPIVGGLPDVPGIVAAMRLTPGLGVHLRGLADELLVNDFPGATHQPPRARDARDRRLGRRTTASSAWTRTARSPTPCSSGAAPSSSRRSIDVIKLGSSDGFDAKMQALLHIARTVRRDPLELTADRRRGGDATPARPMPTSSWRCSSRPRSRCTTGSSTGSGRGRRRAPRPIGARAGEIAEHGYSAPSPSAAAAALAAAAAAAVGAGRP